MTNDDVLYVYRLRVLATAAELGSGGCGLPDPRHPPLDVLSLEGHGRPLRPRDPAPERAQGSPDAQLGPGADRASDRRVVARASRDQRISPTNSHVRSTVALGSRPRVSTACCVAMGCTHPRAAGLLAGYAAPPELPRDPEPERHIKVDHPGELVQFGCFCIGRLAGTKGVVWQYTAIDAASSFCWAELHVTPRNPDTRFCSLLAHRVAKDLRDAGWDFERVTTDNGSEFRNVRFDATIEHLGATHTRSSAPDVRSPTASSSGSSALSLMSVGSPRSPAISSRNTWGFAVSSSAT